MTLEQIAGIAHEPAGTPQGTVLLTHGAGGNRDATLLVGLCDEWARRGYLAVRYNLPYRRRRPKGPPSNSAASDQDGIAEAIAWARGLGHGPVIAGGHSYGGRMTSMVAAREAGPDVLALTSYPLHPPGKPERARTEHLPDITVPTVFTHGTADPFGTLDEVRDAARLVTGSTEIVAITGARHDLVSKTLDVPVLTVSAAVIFLS
ncbi:alpha/beta hydrolase family protein [Mycobacterium sp. NPDC003323]